MATFDDFLKLDIRVGEIIEAKDFNEARNPAYKIWIDFGEKIGIKRSSAQITECYSSEELIGTQVLGVVNFPPKKIAGFTSEVLILGVYAKQGVVLVEPSQAVKKGDKLG